MCSTLELTLSGEQLFLEQAELSCFRPLLSKLLQNTKKVYVNEHD